MEFEIYKTIFIGSRSLRCCEKENSAEFDTRRTELVNLMGIERFERCSETIIDDFYLDDYANMRCNTVILVL